PTPLAPALRERSGQPCAYMNPYSLSEPFRQLAITTDHSETTSRSLPPIMWRATTCEKSFLGVPRPRQPPSSRHEPRCRSLRPLRFPARPLRLPLDARRVLPRRWSPRPCFLPDDEPLPPPRRRS